MKRTRLVATVLIVMVFVASQAVAQGTDRPPPQGPDGPPPERFNPLLRMFDVNNDGVLSDAEMAGAAAKLRALDKNKDGKLDADELRAAMPFGGGRGMPGPGGPPGGPGRGPGGSSAGQTQFTAATLPKDEGEKKILDTLNEMRKGPRFANVPTSDGRFLRQLTESLGAKLVVEIGTSSGESGVWFAMALRKTGGKLITHEIDPRMVKVAGDSFKKAGVGDIITIVEGDAHETVKQLKGPIDLLFLDADKEGYLDYLQKLLPLVRPGGLIVAHNMNSRQADPRYVEAITKSADLDTSFVTLEGGGIGVTLKKR